MDFRKEYLDLVLVPGGLLIMFGYHIFLLKHHSNPDSTIIGQENKDRKEWVQRVVQGGDKDFDRAVTVISSNTSAATYLATISLTLSSLIGTWLGSTSNANYDVFFRKKVYGDTSPFTIFIKNVCLLACLLFGFSGFVQAARRLVHGNYLMSSPDNKRLAKKIEFDVIRGGDFWLFGLRALYFGLTMLLWYFGPMPMFVSSLLMVIILYYSDIHVAKLKNIYSEANG